MTNQSKRKINRMVYISGGNVPSRAANVLQTMKMASAFSKVINDFRIVVNVSVFNFNKKHDLCDLYNIEKVKISRLPFSINREIFFPRNYSNTLFTQLTPFYAKFKNPDVVYTRPLSIAKRCLQLGLNVVLERHGESPENYNYMRSKEFRNSNFLGCVTISQRLKNFYVSRGIPPEKINVEQDGVTLSDYSIKADKSDIRKNLDLPIDKYIIAFTGHLYDLNGIPLILQAAKELKNDLFLLVGGWEHDIKRVKLKCKRQEINNVICYGYVKPKLVPKLLYASDLLLLPISARHMRAKVCSPLKMFEYMASGRPIVASNLENISSILQNEKNALLFEPDSFESFKEKILFAKENKEKAKMFASQAKLDVEYYEWSKRAGRIIKFIENQMFG